MFTIKRVAANSQPPTPPATITLNAPVFSPATEAVPYGDTVKITSSSMPAGSILEYSKDNGTTWVASNQVIIYDKGDVLARTRLNQQTSSSTKQSFTPYFQRMLVIGNSIMLHPPAPSLGWYNNNGMAASAPEKDFVHLLTGYLTQANPQLSVRLQYGNNFETNFGKSDYSLDEFNAPLQEFQPDLIVLRLGENVDEGDVDSRGFEEQFRQLVTRLAGYGKPVKLVTTTSVWNRPKTDAAIRKVIGERALPLADLGYMVNQGQYFASQYANPGVAAHPNDAGMQEIANQIWAKIQ